MSVRSMIGRLVRRTTYKVLGQTAEGLIRYHDDIFEVDGIWYNKYHRGSTYQHEPMLKFKDDAAPQLRCTTRMRCNQEINERVWLERGEIVFTS